MFLFREIDKKKLCQNYTKIYLYTILYNQQIRNQSENDYISKEPEKLIYAPIIIF